MRGISVLLLLLGLVGYPGMVEAAPLVVIVNPERSGRLGKKDVRRIFLKERRYWDDGATIVPLNHPAASVEREDFSRSLLGDSADSLNSYWNERYFSGVLPPVTLSSDEAVKRYVAAERDAIGYVRPRALDGSVREVLRLK